MAGVVSETEKAGPKDDDRRGDSEHVSFEFLGYTFQPRRAKNRYGKYFVSFLPAISAKAAKSIRQTIREWRMASTRNNQQLEDLARAFNPTMWGWANYYGRFYRSKFLQVLRHFNGALAFDGRRLDLPMPVTTKGSAALARGAHEDDARGRARRTGPHRELVIRELPIPAGSVGPRAHRVRAFFARHTRAIQEAMSTQISAVDEKYADLPARVSRLEAKVFAPKRR